MTNGVRITDAIQWFEGMLLEPHHFQQNDRRLEQLFEHHLALAKPYYWGVQRLEIDPVTLVGGLLRVTYLDAVMPDGLHVYVSLADTAPLEFNIKKNLPNLESEPVKVFLVVNAYREGDGNATGDFARYDSVEGTAVVDENTGERTLKLPRLRPRLSLYLGNEAPGHFVSMPIGEIYLNENAYSLTDFVPPTLRLEISSPLTEKCMDLISRLRRKVAFLMGQVQANAAQNIIGEIRDALRVFLSSLPHLEALVYSGRVHPFDVFLSLAHLAGQLSTLKVGTIPPVFDFYRHNNLKKTFNQVLDFVVGVIETIQDGYVVVPLTKTDRIYTLKLRPDLLGERFVLGAKTPGGATDRDMEDWIRDAVIVTESYVQMAQDRRILGAKRSVVYGDDKLKLIPTKGMTLFSVPNDPAFIRGDESLILFNLSDREGMRPSEIVLFVSREQELKNVA